MPNVARLLSIAVGAALLSVAIAMPGCGDDESPGAFNPNGTKRDGGIDGSTSGGEDGICLLNNCDLDRDCASCGDGATTCLKSEHRCVACGPGANGKQCGSGQTCTKYGNCVGPGIACEEGERGIPTITCKNTADCGACGPQFRVCDTASGKCVGCSDTNTTNCQATDLCKAGKCTPKCPAACDTDEQCKDCGGPGSPAKVCNNHICAECSATKACADGKSCDVLHGKCVATCGVGTTGGSQSSKCSQDGSCEGCTAAKKCKLPVNHEEGKDDGVCAVPATGCSDIGKGIIVLPAPFDRVTNACSGDADCANQSLDVNVGKILRDATGLDAIKDANINYSMHACASVEVLDKSCGVCVPCKVDTDCADIDIAAVGGDMFGPLGSVAASILLDKAFGPNDHKIHMFCQNVAGDYGVCAPCADILHGCGTNAENASCDHDVCTKGSPLGVRCGIAEGSACVAQVCAKDPYCCAIEWDEACKVDVDRFCDDKTCTPNSCAFREAGWYCNTDGTQGGYECAGDKDGDAGTTASGHQCATGKCKPSDANKPKSKAVLCETEGDDVPGCPTGSKGKPKCE